MVKPTRDIGASVRARLLNLARERGQVLDLLLTRYALERLLYRRRASKITAKALDTAPTEMRAWMRREGQLAFFSEDDPNAPDAYTNPYPYSASTTSAPFARTFNSTHVFGTSTDPDTNTARADQVRARR
jgi:hypothetical protein